ncbi:MAG: GAF domain-containing protein, partial [candidate division NC10 bacterium]|nr:GAF domain-containing protein [candidate division NC10 bacterium]
MVKRPLDDSNDQGVQGHEESGASLMPFPARDQVLWDIFKRFLETMHVDRCAIALCAPGEASAQIIVGFDRSKEDPWIEGVNLSLDRYPEFRRVLETQQPLVVPDVAEEPVLSGIREFLLSLPIRSMLVVPLLRQDQSIGVVSLSTRGTVRNFTPDEIVVCQTLASQAALTLEKTALFHEVQERANKLQSLIHLTKLMTASLNLQEVYDFAVKAAAEFLDVPCAWLVVADEEMRELRVQASYGMEEFVGLMVERIPYGVGVIGEIMERGEPQYIADVRQEPRLLNRRFVEQGGVVSFAGIPLISDGRVLGALAFFTLHRRFFTPDERTLISAFASQAAVAIVNARAYQQIQRYAKSNFPNERSADSAFRDPVRPRVELAKLVRAGLGARHQIDGIDQFVFTGRNRQQRNRAIVIDAVSQQRSVILSPPVPGQNHPAGTNGRCPCDDRDRVGPVALAVVSRSGDRHPQPFPHHLQSRDERIITGIHD